MDTSLHLDGVVCVVDSKNILTYLSSEVAWDVRMQISYADRILLNKTDLITPNEVRTIP